MPRRIPATCGCCGLTFYAADRGDMWNVTGDIGPTRKPRRLVCAECNSHQGSAPEQELKRLRAHEAELRRRMAAARSYAEKAEAKLKDYRERVASALESRDRAIDKLRQVQDIHTMRPDGSCTCGTKKDCRTGAVVLDRWIVMMMSRQDWRD